MGKKDRKILLVVFLVLICVIACTNRKQFDDISFHVSEDTLIIKNSRDKTLEIINPLILYDGNTNFEPTYVIDSLQSILYLYNIHSDLRSINLRNLKTTDINGFDSVINHESDYELVLHNGKILLSSNKRLLIFNEDLELEQSIVDSIMINHPHIGDKAVSFGYSLGKDSISIIVNYLTWDFKIKQEIVKDTILRF